MKAISVRQPWAWLIVNGYKDIENRSWPTHQRGKVLIHAAKSMTRKEYNECRMHSELCGVMIPPFENLQRGGIVGEATISDCVATSSSPWFFGKYGFVLTEQKPLPFLALKGQLGFFSVSVGQESN
jgi:hypothetical protein